MAVEREVQEFAQSIDAKIKNFSFFKGNIFYKEDRILLIKISRTKNPFWGLNGNLMDLLLEGSKENKIKFSIILLITSYDGWVYPQSKVINMIENKRWKKNSNGQYLINSPLDHNLSFSTHQKCILLLS